MSRQLKIFLAVVIIVIVVAAACVFGYVSGQQPEDTTEPNQTVEPTTPDEPDTPDDTQQENPVQPENPNPTGGDSAVVYVPDEQGETLTPVGTDVADDSDQALVDALIAAGSLPEGAAVQSSSTADGVLTLDMNAVYGDAVRSSGTTGESLLIYSLVNTFVQARGVNSVIITVDGAPLESGHEIYDYPLEATN
ncbi:GerMN domain-containing protein [Agathobaculum sp. Marseille-P7918]|uniref:GerMN domain-containing protein n=1 Tax=Agathobaculum sp. Marseille-P7918 TaxID=2479843 RepID=UPI000F639EAE|nr:GerMN domain-containing protein [Agathobaculum sp. Marseille-P7918]